MGEVLSRLVKHFGTQQKAAKALGVDQTTVSGWVRGKHSVSPKVAVRIETATGGIFSKSEVCPDFPWSDLMSAEHGQLMGTIIEANGQSCETNESAGIPSSTAPGAP
ncbi:Cro/CI family transcriptional regulator [Pseudomonas sp. GD04058]|uniref:transcriptional regulator n=1 Tax=Pseudomonas sp. GD04058 TaxID=2975429 RepID=UPI00326034D6